MGMCRGQGLVEIVIFAMHFMMFSPRSPSTPKKREVPGGKPHQNRYVDMQVYIHRQ